MKRFWTAMAVIFFGVSLFGGCNDYNSSIQNYTGASLVAISPTWVGANNGSFTITTIASSFNGFTNATVIEVDGVKITTNYIDATTLTGVVPANLVSKPGLVKIYTYTPQSGSGRNGLSNPINLHVAGTPNPVATLTSITPTTTSACGTSCANVSLNITINGTNFLGTSVNGGSVVGFVDKLTPLQQPTYMNITSISSTQIQAVIPGTYLANADTGTVYVINPPSLDGCNDPSCAPLVGGGYSNGETLTITGAAAAAASAVAEETPALSHDGRYVAYSSVQNEISQILLRDTCLGAPSGCAPATRVISAASDGTPGNADSHNAVISSDGRYIAYSSAATNLMENAPAGRQIYLRDTCVGAATDCKQTTTLVSLDSEGKLNGTESVFPSISSSGRFVAFLAITPGSGAKISQTGKSPSQTAPDSGLRQVFVRDTCLGESNCTPKTTRISMAPGEAPATGIKPAGPALSGLARQLAIPDAAAATPFTQTIPIDERVFLALPKQQ